MLLFISVLSIILLISLIFLLFSWSLILCIYTENKHAYEHLSLIEGLKYFAIFTYVAGIQAQSINTYTEAVVIEA